MTDRPTLRRARGALLLIAAACLGYWTWATADALVYRHVEERRLEQAIAERPAASRGVDDPVGGASSANDERSLASPSYLAAGEPAAPRRSGGSSADSAQRVPSPSESAPTVLGRLEIPSIGLSTLVARDSDRRSLRRAAGHVAGTALPGEGDNVGVAGHRDTVFRELRRVEAGDRVTLTTPAGTHRYAVESLRVVPPDAVDVLAPTDGETLTLVTCYPFGAFGPAPDRFVVRARLLGTG